MEQPPALYDQMRLTSEFFELTPSVIRLGVGSRGQFRDERCNQLHLQLLARFAFSSYFRGTKEKDWYQRLSFVVNIYISHIWGSCHISAKKDEKKVGLEFRVVALAVGF